MRLREIAPMTEPQKHELLFALWDTWPLATLIDFCVAITAWYSGKGYMHTEEKEEEDEFIELTPFDFFKGAHPKAFTDYTKLVDSQIAIKPRDIYRTILFHQAEDILSSIEYGDADFINDLANSLIDQNTLSFSRPIPIDKSSFVWFEHRIDVRSFSSWTISPKVAYTLSHSGGVEQIGEGAVIVRADDAALTIAHTIVAGTAFEKYARRHPDLDALCPSFINPWKWQQEYVVYAPKGVVSVTGVAIVSTEGSEFYERVMALSEQDE